MKKHKQPKGGPLPQRRLEAPQMNIVPKLSLPQVLSQCNDDKEHRDWARHHWPDWAEVTVNTEVADAQHQAESARPWTAQMESLSHLKPTTPSTRPSTTATKRSIKTPQSARTAGKMSSLWSMALFEDAAGAVGAEGLNSSCSPELAKRRAIHPRLRWPRLVCVPLDNARSEGVADAAGTDCDKGGNTGGGACNGDSVSTAGAASPSVVVTEGSSVKLRRPKPKVQGPNISRYGFEVTREKGPPSRPRILPRATSRQEPSVGSSSTLHAPCVFDRDGAFGRFNKMAQQQERRYMATQLYSSSVSEITPADDSEAALSQHEDSDSEEFLQKRFREVDRKWFLRMAPISCLPAEANAKAVRRAIHDEADEEADVAVSGEAGEYLNFERWGLNDDYITALVAAHGGGLGLNGLRHVNLSGNQLSEHGIVRLAESGATQSFLTLDLSRNRLTERGGRAAVSLIRTCRQLRDVNLSGNPLGDVVLEELCGVLAKMRSTVEGVGLAQCNIGQLTSGGTALGHFVATSQRLKCLDLHWNMFHGEGAHALLRGVLDNGETCYNLRRLNLAWNRLGCGVQSDAVRKKDAATTAKLLASIFKDSQILVHLDLSYNNICADDCAVLAHALNENHTLFGLHLVGNDATVDDLGFIVPLRRGQQQPPPLLSANSSPPASAALASASAVAAAAAAAAGDFSGGVTSRSAGNPTRSSTKLSPKDNDIVSIPRISTPQFHEDMQEGKNELVNGVPGKFRLQHRADFTDFSLVKVMHTKESQLTLRHNPSLNSLASAQVSTFSTDDLAAERRWVQSKFRVQPLSGAVDADLEAVQRNARCCWICENWVEHRVAYTPGISGVEVCVDSAFALFALDGFTRPTKLTPVEESVKARKSDARRRSSGGGAGHRRGSNMSSRRRSSDGRGREKVTRWVGTKMLPPSMEPAQMVFVVNGKITVADDMPQRKLVLPKVVALQPEHATMMECKTNAPQLVDTVNEVAVGLSAWDKFSMGFATALCVLEDPSKSGSIAVLPRQVNTVDPVKKEDSWKIESSCFKDYHRDNQLLCDRCFDRDWHDSRLDKIVRGVHGRDEIAKVLKPKYQAMMLVHACSAFPGFESEKVPAGIGLQCFRDMYAKYGGEGAGRLIDGASLKLTDVDVIFVASNVIERGRKTEFQLIPHKALMRFQLLEAVVRTALRRFMDRPSIGGSPSGNYEEAMSKFMEVTRLGLDLLELRDSFRQLLFTQECDRVFREHMDLLLPLFEGYKKLSNYPGRYSTKTLSYMAWDMLLRDSGIITSEFPHHNVGMAFALARQTHLDEVTNWRCMELSFTEFLIALAFVVRLQPDYEPENLDDALDEFIETYMEEAFDALQNRIEAPKDKRTGAIPAEKEIDPTIQPVVALVKRLHEQASGKARAGTEVKDFRYVSKHPDVREDMVRVKLSNAEVEVLLRKADADCDGFVTQAEVVDAIIVMRQLLKGKERAIGFLERAFAEVDEDDRGGLSTDEFQKLFGQSAVLRKLANLGISSEDFSELVSTFSGNITKVTMPDVIEGLMTLCDPAQAGMRGVNVLMEYFQLADVDRSGGLSKAEVMNTYTRTDVVRKLQRLELTIPDWEVLFDELDVDGSGDLSWEEICEGMAAFWGSSQT